jgi:hypothetical protein
MSLSGYAPGQPLRRGEGRSLTMRLWPASPAGMSCREPVSRPMTGWYNALPAAYQIGWRVQYRLGTP